LGEEESKNSDMSEDIKPKKSSQKTTQLPDGAPKEFPKSFIFSCIGIGLTNIARKTE
jgi:hypothetical protein